jgi:hypothetical protein
MDLIEHKSNQELLKSVLAEIAKAKNEIRCAQADLIKATNRLGFSLLVLNKLINREEDKQK